MRKVSFLNYKNTKSETDKTLCLNLLDVPVTSLFCVHIQRVTFIIQCFDLQLWFKVAVIRSTTLLPSSVLLFFNKFTIYEAHWSDEFILHFTDEVIF